MVPEIVLSRTQCINLAASEILICTIDGGFHLYDLIN